MFTFKPAPKNDANGNGNGHSANGSGNSSETGQSAPAAAVPAVMSASNANSTGPAAITKGPGLAGWLGLGGNGNGHVAAKTGPLRKDNHNGHKFDSVIGPGIHFKGTLTGAGSMRIDGTFDGTINIQGPLLITDGAKVTAEVRAGAVSVGGSLKGNVVAGKVEILSTGRVWGDLLTTAFATEEGAFLRGQVRMEDDMPPAPTEAAPAPNLGTEAAAL